MTRRLAVPAAPGPLEDCSARFDEVFGYLAQRRGFASTWPGCSPPSRVSRRAGIFTGG